MAILNGTGGDDVWVGTAQTDTGSGGGGNDTIWGEAGVDALAGGAGNDTVHGGDHDDDLYGESGVDKLYGDGGNDELKGAADNDTLYGGAGVDDLDGGSGNDYLYGGTGADVMRGNVGNDTYEVDSYNDVLIEFAGLGTDMVHSKLTSWTLGEHFENLRYTGNNSQIFHGTGNAHANVIIGGKGDDTLEGLAGADILAGGDGNDTLDGGTGADVMQGGLGNDVYTFDNDPYGYDGAAADKAIEAAGQGYDMIVVAASGHYDMSVVAQNVEDVMVLDNTYAVVTGNALANTMYGNDAVGYSQIFDGGAGDDKLYGLGGMDTLTGGLGDDILDGGAGDLDTASYLFSTSGIVVNLAQGQASNDGLGGSDTLLGIEIVQGSEFDDAITGDGASNILWGKGGDDALAGGAGDDYLSGDAGADAFNGGAGSDFALVYDLLNPAQGAVVNLATGEATGAAAGDTFLSIENLGGTNNADELTGDGGANILAGYEGDDVLSGAGGSDRLVGGVGADTLNGGGGSDWAEYNDITGDLVVDLLTGTGSGAPESAGDVLISIENLQGGVFADTLRGTDGVNVLLGGNGSDHLVGRGGDDTLRGEIGADVLTGGVGADRFLFKAVEESEAGGLRDRVTDFSHAEGDLLLLEAIDANIGAAGNQAFVFIGGGGVQRHGGRASLRPRCRQYLGVRRRRRRRGRRPQLPARRAADTRAVRLRTVTGEGGWPRPPLPFRGLAKGPAAG